MSILEIAWQTFGRQESSHGFGESLGAREKPCTAPITPAAFRLPAIVAGPSQCRSTKGSHIPAGRVSTNLTGAQRLSASTDGSHRSRYGRRAFQFVLNAFRHQRTDHGQEPLQTSRSSGVLNAFRHQRTDHTFVVGRAGLNPWCSTPFGINGRITGWNGERENRDWGVLNAFRHQRTDHLTKRPSMIGGLMCSTPFGINGRITRRRLRSHRGLCRAQRLSASTDGSRAGDGAVSGHTQVLNAFRHQRTDHWRWWFFWWRFNRVLNAFRHQRTDHGAASRRAASARPVLNAFRHQRTDH